MKFNSQQKRKIEEIYLDYVFLEESAYEYVFENVLNDEEQENIQAMEK